MISSGNYKIIFNLVLVFMLYSSQAHSACKRDDVEFYLAKGFSPDQITSLCASSTANEVPLPDSKPEPSLAVDAEGDNERFLKLAIKAKKIYLGNNYLHYTQEVCIEYGEEDLYGFTPKVCPKVNFKILLNGLEVVKTGKRNYFYGTPEVVVKSTIKREIIGQLKDQKPAVRKQILDKFEMGNETVISIREDFSLQRVKQVLQQLSK